MRPEINRRFNHGKYFSNLRVIVGWLLLSILVGLPETRAQFSPRGSLPAQANNFVSLRDLKVPGKARRAFEKGLRKLAKDDPSGSLEHFNKATKEFPGYYEAYFQIGVAEILLNRRDAAEEALQKSIDLSAGRYSDAEFTLGALWCKRGEFADAERVLRRGLEVDASSWRGYLLLGAALLGLNRLEEAEKNTREAVLRNPDSAGAYLLLACVHMRENSCAMALRDLDACFKLRPNNRERQSAEALRAEAQLMLAKPH